MSRRGLLTQAALTWRSVLSDGGGQGPRTVLLDTWLPEPQAGTSGLGMPAAVPGTISSRESGDRLFP